MVHLFRPAEPAFGTLPPVGAWSRVQRAKGRLLVALRRVAGYLWQRRRPCILFAVAAASLVTQLVALLLAAYLVDLSLSLMELWAELARKHLEITL